MAHRRVKDISYDEDDADDFEEFEDYHNGTGAKQTATDADDELSPEDEEQLQAGTVAVRAEIADIGDSIEDREIREALWYYYYDIQKAVDWLRRQRKPQPKKQKQPSRFEEAAAAAAEKKSTLKVPQPSTCPNYLRAADFFADTPFLAVPPSRLGILTPVKESLASRARAKGGLLGGSPSGEKKPSKLAALAASRKKAAEEKRKAVSASSDGQGPSQADGDSQTPGVGSGQQQGSVALLDKLGQGRSQGQKIVQKESGQPSLSEHASPRSYPRRENSSKDAPPSAVSPEGEDLNKSRDDDEPREEVQQKTAPSLEDLQADPSIFAQALFSSSTTDDMTPLHSPRSDNKSFARDMFTLPYPIPKESSPTASKGKGRDNVSDPFAGPSPDDIVTQAQSKGSKQGTRTPTKKSAEQDTAETAGALESIKLDSKIKSKNLDVVAEFEKSNMKNSANFVVIGHVDHGKSTLMGRLLHDLSLIPSRTFHKLQTSSQQAGKGSFSFAWLLDTTESERSRGVTVDVASTTFSTSSTDFTILDAPGHKDFVPNMIAGTSQADFAVLVVDATTDAFEKGMEGGGQTKEHALLARALGINRIIVAVNKMDAAHPTWSKDRFETVSQQMAAFLSSAGFATKNVAFIPCAGLTGGNIVKPLGSSDEDKAGESQPWSWYQGPTLLEQLDTTASAAPTTRIEAIHSPLRLVISDVFRGAITSPLSVSARIDTGSLQVGDILLAQPSGEKATIKGIEISSSSANSEGGSADWAVAGQIVTLHLTDIDPVHLRAGDVLCSQSYPVQNVSKFTTKILAFDFLMPGPLDVLKGRLQTEARVTRLVETLDKKADNNDSSGGKVGQKKKPRVVKPGTLARIEVKLDKKLPLEKGNRVVLRNEGLSIAAGVVEGVAGDT